MGKKYFLLLIFLASSFISFSQTYTMNNGANGTISTCSGTFVDQGGAANYANSQNSTITFCPSTPGDKIRIVFNTFATEGAAGTCTDYLDVWYANAVGALGTNNDRLCGALGTTTLVSTSPDGCISFQFISNNSVRDSGWSATVSCVTPCTNPIAALTDTTTLNICSSSATNPGSLAVSFNGSASTAPGGFSITSYEWTWGDGTNSTTAAATTSHTFPGPGIYSVSLSVRNNNTDIDPLGCQSTNASTRLIRVLPPPDFTGSTLSTFNINCGNSINLNGLATSETMSTGPLSVSGSPVSLPDGSGVSYTTTLDFTGVFPVGATVTPGCYPTVTFDLEHTYSGDLDIILISPTGQSVILYDQHGGGIDFGLCTNPADDGVAGCPATYTVVSTGGVAWTAAGVTTTAPANGTCSYTGVCEAGTNYISQTYNSSNPFTPFNGADLNGVWTLQITDNIGFDDGTITGWSLAFPGSCYANAEFVTPDVSTLTWSHSGAGPVIPAQTTTSTSVTDPGPDGCPSPGTCIGNQLTNNVAVGPFPTPGSYVYSLTAVDEYGCNYVRNVTVNVAACACNLNLTSAVGTNNQTVCRNSAISSITYGYGGSATGVTFSGLPAGVTGTWAANVATISGTPTASGTFNYTITTVGCTPNLSLNGTITVTPLNTIAAGINRTTCINTAITSITLAT
ncbi:PKD domain-containing protein, partial [Flavobacterium bernardetii]